MFCIKRYEKYKNDYIDLILRKIRDGEIKAGRYSDLVKVNKNAKFKGKEFFNED